MVPGIGNGNYKVINAAICLHLRQRRTHLNSSVMKYNGKETQVKEINCDQAIKMLMDYLDDYLKHNRKNELEKHLASCSSCMNRYEFQKSLKAKISNLASQPDPSLSKKLKKLLGSL